MNVGIIGLSRDGKAVAEHLLGKTARNLFAYDPDGRVLPDGLRMLPTAAELIDRCGRVILALESPRELTLLLNSVAEYIREGKIFIDLTDTSPALAHMIANEMRRRGALYLDCGVFGRDGLADDFLCFAGGSSRAFAEAQPLIRCFAPGCRYMGPSGRGRAMRLLCRSLAAQLRRSVGETGELAASFGIGEEYLLECLSGFERIADPLAVLRGEQPPMPDALLAKDVRLVAEMARRAGLELGGLRSAEEAYKSMDPMEYR